ncbi:MAG: hypothetical protein DMENIID0002_09330 [Rickettsia endosymbiont of Sergentomyia squamirostris]|uniref:Uncharacterized protein n=1 Tax=Candidatus Tisiphia endosymbiont of Sergentomyia squamirostris TaxID=3113639 RepID=A0AAT9G900_9RICK
MLSSCIPKKNLQEKLLIKALYDQIKEKNVNNLTQEELDQFVKNACHEAKSTEGFPVNHIQALRILSKVDFSEINENYSCINESLTKLYLKQQITFEHYHLQQEEGLHFYMVKVTGKNADMWKEYATYEKNASRKYQGDKVAIKEAYNGSIAFIPSIDYHDQNDVWVAFVSDKQQDIDNIDPTSIEMSVTMMTSEHAHFTSHMGISRGVSYIRIPHKNISCKLHSFIATVTLQHYGDCGDTLYTVNKDYMITAPIAIMRAILIKAFKEYDTDIFIGDNTIVNSGGFGARSDRATPICNRRATSDDVTNFSSIDYTECSEETLEVLTKKLESMQKDDFRFNNTQLALTIKQQHEKFKKAGITVPIKITNGEGSNECLNWVLQNKEGKVLHNLNTQDMEGEYPWFFKSPWLWDNRSCFPIVTCDIKILANLAHFNLPFEHEYQVGTIGDCILTE